MSRMFFDMLEVNIVISVIILVLCTVAGKLRKRYGASWMKLAWLLLAVRLVIPYNFSLPSAEIRLFSTPAFEQGESVFRDMSQAQEDINIENYSEMRNEKPAEAVQAVGNGEGVYNSVEHTNQGAIHSNNTVIAPDKENEGEVISQTFVGSEETVAKKRNFSYAEIMTGIWMLGIVLASLYNVLCYLRFSSEYKKGLKEITDKELERKIFEMQKKFIGRPLPVYQSRSISSPMLIGLFKPRLVIPLYMKQWNEDELEMIVAHELCHYKKKDLFLKLFMVVTCCMNWFNPFVYWMKKQFFYDVELSCDGNVLLGRSEEEREAYARIMLTFAGKPRQFAAFSTGFGESKKRMKKRIDYMLDTGRKRRGILSIVLTGVIIMTMTVFVSCGYKPYETNSEETPGVTGMDTSQGNENSIQEDIEAGGAAQEDMRPSFDYNHEYNEMLRSYGDNVYLAGTDGIYCIKTGGEKELIYENAYHNLRGMEIYQDYLYFCGSAPGGEKDAATIYRMNLETNEVEDALAAFSHLFVGFSNISIYDEELYVLIGNGKRLGFELNQNGQIIKLLEETKADFLFKEQNEYVELEQKKWNTAYDSEEYWSIVKELNEKYCPVMDVAACKKLLQGKQVVSKYKNEMYRSLYLLGEVGAYEYLCDTVYNLPLLVTESGVYYAINERGEIGYVDYATKTLQQIYAVDGIDEIDLVNYDAEYVYLVKKSYIGWEEGETGTEEMYLIRIPREGGQAETVYRFEGDIQEYGWPIRCAVYDNQMYFENHDVISLEVDTLAGAAIPLQLWEQEDVVVIPDVAEYEFAEAYNMGTVQKLNGILPGASEGSWYIIVIDGIEYYYGQYANQQGDDEPLYYGFSIVSDTYSLANGISVGLSKDEICEKYPNMGIMNFEGDYLEKESTPKLGWNGSAYPRSYLGMDDDWNYNGEDFRWENQYDYVMIADIVLEGDTLPACVGLLMKDDKVATITFFKPTAG